MEPDLMQLKRLFVQWQEEMAREGGWNAVFWCNHDQPRAVSRFGDDKAFWKESAKMLATAIHMFRGTPYIYQGEELGMTNAYYTDISQYRDVESTNYYKILQERGCTGEEALRILQNRSRDNGRTPMQWDSSEHAGFSTAKPWLQIPDNHATINAEAEKNDEDSILNYHKHLIVLRKQYPVIAEGSITFEYPDHPQLLSYRRRDTHHELIVHNNLTGTPAHLPDPFTTAGWKKLITNYNNPAPADSDPSDSVITTLRPYESIVYIRENANM